MTPPPQASLTNPRKPTSFILSNRYWSVAFALPPLIIGGVVSEATWTLEPAESVFHTHDSLNFR